MEQTVEELKQRIDLYRQELLRCGHNAASRKVTVMLHTFLGDDTQEVKSIVKSPLVAYLRNHMRMYEKNIRAQSTTINLNIDAITEKDKAALIERGFERYFNSNGLFGDIQNAMNIVQRLYDAGVDEIACLINFGATDNQILASLEKLSELQRTIKASCKTRPS